MNMSHYVKRSANLHFGSIIKWDNFKTPLITLSEHPMEMKPLSVRMILTLRYVKHPQTLNL